jgi:carboxyl-terminal processing protease
MIPGALRLVASLAAVLLASACASFDPYGVITRHTPEAPASADGPVPPPPSAGLGAERRLAAFDYVWSTIAGRYYDPAMNGVDWKGVGERYRPQVLGAQTDERFWDLLDRMTGELRDSHTRVESPQRAEQIERNESVSLGFSLRLMEERLVISSVHPESDAWWAGVRAGMTLTQVGGESAMPVYERLLAEAREGSSPRARHASAVRRLVAGEPGTKATATFERADGTSFSATLSRRPLAYPPTVASRVLPSGFGYIRLTQWSHSLQSRMTDAIERHKDLPGLVIDLRGNPGGSAIMVQNVEALFFSKKTDAGRTLTRTGRPITIAFDLIELVKLKQELDGTGTYLGPVVVLVDAASGSGSELFSGTLQALGRAVVVGETTCGCLLGYLGYANIPGGGKLAYSEMGFVFPNGRRIEGEGVVPDKVVRPGVADLQLARDPALEEAQSLLGAMKPWEAKTASPGAPAR